jgi:surface polysaccharide O-acyltransferase-like enzyme
VKDRTIVSEEISSRIEVLRFPLILGVIFIHNYSAPVSEIQRTVNVEPGRFWVDFTRFFISFGVAQTTVPLFFLISGYLFFSGEWSWKNYLGKLERRFHTLLIPFLFWNLLTLAVVALLQSIPQAKISLSGATWQLLLTLPLLSCINVVFGLSVTFPIALQFWFIRDLMALVVFAPVIHFLLTRKWALLIVLVLFCLWFASAWPILWPFADASFFFVLGAYLSRPGKSVNYLDRFGWWITAIFLGTALLESAFPYSLRHLHKFVILFGIPGVWWIAGLTVKSSTLKTLLLRLSGASFFVFAAHMLLLPIMREISNKLFLPASGVAILALYFLLPICLAAFLTAVYFCLRILAPSFTSFITGDSVRSNPYHV